MQIYEMKKKKRVRACCTSGGEKPMSSGRAIAKAPRVGVAQPALEQET
jgi:hypothetical protein